MNNKKNREIYDRVTTILYPFSGLDGIPPQILSNAAARGTKVHKICEGIIDGLGDFGVDEETWGYVQSFKQWWELGHKVVKMEERFWDDDLQITGQLDIIIDTPEGLAIVDLKTSSKPSKTWAAQGCAYAMMARKCGYDIKKIYFLHLSKIGKPSTVLEYPVDDNFFLEIYRVWKYFFKGHR